MILSLTKDVGEDKKEERRRAAYECPFMWAKEDVGKEVKEHYYQRLANKAADS